MSVSLSAHLQYYKVLPTGAVLWNGTVGLPVLFGPMWPEQKLMETMTFMGISPLSM